MNVVAQSPLFVDKAPSCLLPIELDEHTQLTPRPPQFPLAGSIPCHGVWWQRTMPLSGNMRKEKLWQHARDVLERDLGILRLFGFDSVFAPYLFVDLLGQDFKFIQSPAHVVWGPAMLEHFDLTQDASERLQTFWKRYRHLTPETPGFRRFAAAPMRPMIVDRVFDYVTVLEQCFTSERWEGRAQVLSRCMAALARTRQEAEEMLKMLDEAYEIRNKVAHGHPFNGEVVDIGIALRQLTRRALCMLEATPIGRRDRIAMKRQLWLDLQIGGPLYLRSEAERSSLHFECQEIGLMR